MSDIEVHLDWTLGRHRIGTMRRVASRGGERMSFEYDVDWLASPLRFELDPLLPLTACPAGGRCSGPSAIRRRTAGART